MKPIPVVVADVRLCPGTSEAMTDCLAFWDRWTGRTLLVGSPFAGALIQPAFPGSVVCDTDLYWPVLGPPEFLQEFQQARFGDCESKGGGVRPVLCRHMIVGD